MKALKLKGQRFGRLVVVRRAGKNKFDHHLWKCRCDCGKQTIQATGHLHSGLVQSCGCLAQESRAKRAGRRALRLKGRKFGRLTVLRRVGKKQGKFQWACQCNCGRIHLAVAGDLNNGRVKSCGCIRIEMMTKHGHTESKSGRTLVSPTYSSWRAMKTRCLNANHIWFSKYGGANPPVEICNRWLGEHGFENFLADLGKRLPGTTLGRFGDVGNYEPRNVAWMTWREQRQNHHRKCQKIAA